MKTIILLFLTCLSFSATAQIYIDPSAKVNGVGTIASPYKYITSFRAKTVHYIKTGTTFSYGKEIKNDSVVIYAYGDGDRPRTKSSFIITSKFVEINSIVFSDTTKSDLVTISGGGHVQIANCDFIAKDRPLVISDKTTVSFIGVKIQSVHDGLILDKIDNVNYQRLDILDCLLGESVIWTNIGLVQGSGLTQAPNPKDDAIKEAINLLTAAK